MNEGDTTPEGGSADDDAERFRKATLGGSYLGQAINELRSSGSPETLYLGRVSEFPWLNPVADVLARSQGRRRRVAFARSAILYCILAAEAYVNGYLESGLSNVEFKVIDRLPTFDKYMLGPRLVQGDDVFKRGEQPAQILHELMDLRTRIVHPKPFRAQSGDLGDDPADFAVFNPLAAARHLVAVADAASRLVVPGRQTGVGAEVGAVVLEREFFLEYGKRATDDLPPLRGEPAPDLLLEAIMRWQERDKSGPRASGGDAEPHEGDADWGGQPGVPRGGVAASPSRGAQPRAPSVRAVRFHRAARCPPSRRTRSRAGRASAVQPRSHLPAMPYRTPPPGAPASRT